MENNRDSPSYGPGQAWPAELAGGGALSGEHRQTALHPAGLHAGQAWPGPYERKSLLFLKKYRDFLSCKPGQARTWAWPGLYDKNSLLFFKTIEIFVHMGLARPGRPACQLEAKLYVSTPQMASPLLRAQPAGLGQAHMKGNPYCFEKQ